MPLARRAALAIVGTALVAGMAPAQTGAAQSAENQINVTGPAYRCRPPAGDPLDGVDAGSGAQAAEHMAIVPDSGGGYVRVRNAEQVTGPDFWQRVGVGMGQFVFRAPSSGKPMCVGGHGEAGDFAGYRRIVDAAPYRGHRLRFTAWVATDRARLVSFWLAAGTAWRAVPGDPETAPPRQRLNSTNTNAVSFGGDLDWTPVVLEAGPIDPDADHVSYGFNLQESGDVWVYQPTLEIASGQPKEMRRDDLVAVGRD